MADAKQPRGYFTKLLIMDCETTGLAFNADDPSFNPATGEEYQSISWGFVVVNAQTLKVLDELYVEIKWDGESKWSMEAQKVHGMSPKYLEDNGVDTEDAVSEIANLILKHWGPDAAVCTAGHNVTTFDLPFLRRLLRKCEIEIRFGSRHIDTNTVGYTVFGTYNSDDLFEQVGCPARDPNSHNALDDARNVLQTLRTVRSLVSACLDGE